MLKIKNCRIFMKKCNDCGELKLSSKFTKSKYKDTIYLRKECKVCQRKKLKNYKHVCKECGKEFTSKNKNQDYCSHKCSKAKLSRKGKLYYKGQVCRIFFKKCKNCGRLLLSIKYPKIRNSYFNRGNTCNHCGYLNKQVKEKRCLHCGELFKTNRENMKFCSQECYHASKKDDRITTYCNYCGSKLSLSKKDYNRSEKHFCNKECSGKYHKGINNPSYNLELDEEDRRIKRRIFGYKNFRDKVLERDNYTCQISGEKNCKLEVHHLNGYDNYKEARLDIDNGITLSKTIHALFHKIYGYGNNTKEQFEDFVIRYKNKEFN